MDFLAHGLTFPSAQRGHRHPLRARARRAIARVRRARRVRVLRGLGVRRGGADGGCLGAGGALRGMVARCALCS